MRNWIVNGSYTLDCFCFPQPFKCWPPSAQIVVAGHCPLDGFTDWNICNTLYNLHQKKVYTCGKAKYSKLRGAKEKQGDASHPPLSWSNSVVGLAHSLLFIWPPQFWVLGSTKVYTFFWGRLGGKGVKGWGKWGIWGLERGVFQP